MSALDVADEGGDENSYSNRKGSILKYVDSWAHGDTGQTANKAVSLSKEDKATKLQYDCIGVGAGVKAETNRLKREGVINDRLEILPWNAASEVLNPDKNYILGDKESPINKDFYLNLKAQGWWQLRLRFERTYKAVVHGKEYDEEELISIPSDINKLHQLETQLSQPTYSHEGRGKVKIDKKPEGTKSPNLADSVMMNFWPVKSKKRRAVILTR